MALSGATTRGMASVGLNLLRAPAVGLFAKGGWAAGSLVNVAAGNPTWRVPTGSIRTHMDDSMPTFDDKYMKDVKESLKTRERMSPELAAGMLQERLNIPVVPGAVLNLTADQLHALLKEAANSSASHADKTAAALGGNIAHNKLSEALFVHAETVSNKYFGESVYQRGQNKPSS